MNQKTFLFPWDTSSIFQGKSFTPKLRELFNFQIAPFEITKGFFRYDTQLQVAQSNQAPPIFFFNPVGFLAVFFVEGSKLVGSFNPFDKY